ncbi:MAG: dual specificity protein phosphatase 23 [Gemmatales bacterium]|nr:dual specificity protein phosphatase 23 [Gemmatales bacterium]MDW7995415.1 dual specificity protein phosphatase 23 [Gemmatales bacterium]
MDEAPKGFSWIDKPCLAALARPAGLEDLRWLRQQGLDVIISLTEEPLPRREVNEAGLLVYHVPLEDMMPPSQEDLDRCVSAIERAQRSGLGVAVHCEAGMGRTGVVLACYLVKRGLSAEQAIRRIRQLRPGSIETPEQEDAVRQFAQRHSEPQAL